MRKSRRTRKTATQKTAAAGLLASAAATLLPKAAEATSIIESTDFGDSFGTRDTLASGVDSVQGTLDGSDTSDYFVFTGWQPGTQFTLQITYVENLSSPNTETLEWRAEPTGTLLNSATVTSPPQQASFMGLVPVNGNIAADVLLGNNEANTNTYRINLTATPFQPGNENGGPQGVPESGGTMMLMGATVAGLALAKKMRRRRKKA